MSDGQTLDIPFVPPSIRDKSVTDATIYMHNYAKHIGSYGKRSREGN